MKGVYTVNLAKKYLICKTNVSRSSHKVARWRTVRAQGTVLSEHESFEALKTRNRNRSNTVS